MNDKQNRRLEEYCRLDALVAFEMRYFGLLPWWKRLYYRIRFGRMWIYKVKGAA